MPIPEGILKRFALLDRNDAIDSHWYGPYTMLLSHCFPWSDGYMITPQFEQCTQHDGLVNFVFTLLVERFNRPLFFIEVKSRHHFERMSHRAGADAQTRRRMDWIIADRLFPKAYGVSAFGSSFALYKLEKKPEGDIISPTRKREDPVYHTDLAPAEWWKYDLLEEKGRKKFEELVEKVKEISQERLAH